MQRLCVCSDAGEGGGEAPMNEFLTNPDGTPMTLADAMPREFSGGEYETAPAQQYATLRVVAEFDHRNPSPWPGKEKNVHLWVILQDGRAVGFNENLNRGWSFPMLSPKAVKKAIGLTAEQYGCLHSLRAAGHPVSRYKLPDSCKTLESRGLIEPTSQSLTVKISEQGTRLLFLFEHLK
jgi:hypothetical protein